METVYGFVDWQVAFGRFTVGVLYCSGVILVIWGLVGAVRSGRAMPSKRYGIAAKLIAGLLLLGTPDFLNRSLVASGCYINPFPLVKPGGF